MSGVTDDTRAFQNLLVRLAILMAEDRGQSSEAEQLREEMAAIESRLDDRQVAIVRDLSSDLYMIEDNEVFEDPSPDLPNGEALGRAIYTAYHSGSWERTLRLLRQEAPFLDQAVRAYLRGRAYEGLGYSAAAWAFFAEAARRDYNSTVYKYMALSCLSRWSAEAAKQQAETLLDAPGTHPALCILSVITVLKFYRDSIEVRTDSVRQLAGVLLRAMGEVAVREDTPSEVLASGYAALSVCLEVLGDYANAAQVLQILDIISPHGAQQWHISQFEALSRAGKSRNSGVLINLSVAGERPRPSTLEESVDSRIAGALLVAA